MIRLKNESKWYWNAVRGLCICLVILIHVTVPLSSNSTILPEWYLLRKLTAYPVAVFFFMAGYFVHIEKIGEKSYIWRKLNRVLGAYIVFSIVYICLNNLFVKINWRGVLASFIFGTSEVQMYYCVYLMEMIVLLPLLKKIIIDSKYRKCWLLLILVISCSSAYVTLHFNTAALKPFCFTYLIYYVLGIYARGTRDGYYQSKCFLALKQKTILIPCILVCALFIISYMEGLTFAPYIQYGQTTLGNYPYALSVILLLYALYIKNNAGGVPRLLRPLIWIGERSFSIYLFHMLVMRPMIVWFNNINFTYPWRQLCLFFGTLIICIGVLLLMELIQKRRWFDGKKK